MITMMHPIQRGLIELGDSMEICSFIHLRTYGVSGERLHVYKRIQRYICVQFIFIYFFASVVLKYSSFIWTSRTGHALMSRGRRVSPRGLDKLSFSFTLHRWIDHFIDNCLRSLSSPELHLPTWSKQSRQLLLPAMACKPPPPEAPPTTSCPGL